MRFEYAILGLVAVFSFALLVSAVYPDSISANAITAPKGVNQADTCCIDAKQSTIDLQNKVKTFEGRITQLENMIRTLAQQQQNITAEQDIEAPQVAGIFGTCVHKAAQINQGCNEACTSIGKACAFALEELIMSPNFIPKYYFSACTERNYRDAQMEIHHSCICC